jgi:hypothetical protein
VAVSVQVAAVRWALVVLSLVGSIYDGDVILYNLFGLLWVYLSEAGETGGKNR